MFAIYAQENESPWRAGDATRALETLEGNPFARFEEMQFAVDSPWEPYDHARAAKLLEEVEASSVAFRASRPFQLSGSIFCHPSLRNLVQLKVADEYLNAGDALPASVEFVGELARSLPGFAHGGASADLGVHNFYRSRDLPFLPECFNYVGWYHLISPRGYAPYFEPEDLRRMPAHSVEEQPDGTFAIKSYPDPLAFEDPSVRSQIVEITNYLNALRKDWKTD